MTTNTTVESFEGYWACLFGSRTAESVVTEFELTGSRVGIDEWLGNAEAESWRLHCGGNSHLSEMPESWAAHHNRALNELDAIVRANESED